MSAPDPQRAEPPHVGGPGVPLPDERIAHNETVARSVNEAIEDGRVTREGRTAFVCECGQVGCNAVVELPLQEYEAVRAHPRRFVLVAGHGAHFDEVIAEARDYEVVVKHGVAGRIAEETDPRTT